MKIRWIFLMVFGFILCLVSCGGKPEKGEDGVDGQAFVTFRLSEEIVSVDWSDLVDPDGVWITDDDGIGAIYYHVTNLQGSINWTLTDSNSYTESFDIKVEKGKKGRPGWSGDDGLSLLYIIEINKITATLSYSGKITSSNPIQEVPEGY